MTDTTADNLIACYLACPSDPEPLLLLADVYEEAGAYDHTRLVRLLAEGKWRGKHLWSGQNILAEVAEWKRIDGWFWSVLLDSPSKAQKGSAADRADALQRVYRTLLPHVSFGCVCRRLRRILGDQT